MRAPGQVRRLVVGVLLAIALTAGLGPQEARAQDCSTPQSASSVGCIASSIVSSIGNLGKLSTPGPYWMGLGAGLLAHLKFNEHGSKGTSPPSLSGPAFQGLANGMSCPLFVGAGTLLGEGTCAWMTVSGIFDDAGSQHADSAGTHVGGQVEVAAGWFVGGVLGFSRPSTASADGFTSTGQDFDAALVVKRVDGPLLLAAGLSIATSNRQFSRPSQAFGAGFGTGNMTSSVSSIDSGLRVRGAYQFPFEHWYLRPRMDIDLGWTRRSAMAESGQGLAFAIDGGGSFGVGLTPALEIGGRYDLLSMILRPYLSIGVTYLPDNSQTISGNFAGIPFSLATYGPSIVGTLEAGLQVYQAKGWEIRADYRLSEVDSFSAIGHAVSARIARHF
jgi:hypothetical protein